MNKKILLLLATYNGEEYLDEQLESIVNQKDVDIDIIVSDDFSSDNTVECLDKFKDRINITILNRSENEKGYNFSKNYYNLINNANTKGYDYVAYSDQDDIFSDHKYSEMIYQIEKTKSSGGSSSVQCFGESNYVLMQSKNITKYDYLFEGAGQGCTFILNQKYFEKFQTFVRKNINVIKDFVYHDWLTYLYCRSTGESWYFHQKPLTFYRIHASNHTGSKKNIRGVVMRFRKLFNGWYYKQIILANKISLLINKNIINLENISYLKLLHILIIHGRRKLVDRILAFFGIAFSRLIKNL